METNFSHRCEPMAGVVCASLPWMRTLKMADGVKPRSAHRMVVTGKHISSVTANVLALVVILSPRKLATPQTQAPASAVDDLRLDAPISPEVRTAQYPP